MSLKPVPWETPAPSVLRHVAPAELMGYLAAAGPMIAKATARSGGRWDLGSVVDYLQTGNMDLWVSLRGGEVESCAVTQIVRFPRMKVCAVPFVGGKALRNWLPFELEIGAWAKAQGCAEIEGYDARGGAWLRMLPEWFRGYIQIRKVL